MELPSGVHRVVSRAREYFYYHPGRGTKAPGPRIRLPDDPHSPEFWAALRDAQGMFVTTVTTVGAVLDAYECSPQFRRLTPGSKEQYRLHLRMARQAWADLPAEGLRPVHIRAVLDALAETPGKANGFLGVMRALSAWGRERDHFPQSITEGVKPYEVTGGHKPWTPAQVAAVGQLTGAVRRGVFLALYTGQRGSDVVRLGWADIEEGGFRVRQRKTGRECWCPILPELAAEMATWERQPGPFVRQENGRPYSRQLLDVHFALQREHIPALAGVTLHGLRGTMVVRLRAAGYSVPQISDAIGMSLAMVERYSRFADKVAGGKAAVVQLMPRRAKNGDSP